MQRRLPQKPTRLCLSLQHGVLNGPAYERYGPRLPSHTMHYTTHAYFYSQGQREGRRERGGTEAPREGRDQPSPTHQNYRACWPGGQAQTNRTPILQLLRVVGREEEETEEGVEGRRRRHLQLGTIEAIAVRHANAKAPHPRTTHLLLTPDTHLLRKVTQHIIGTSQRLERKPRGKEGP